MDQVGQQRDAARQREHDDLTGGGGAENEQRQRHCPNAAA